MTEDSTIRNFVLPLLTNHLLSLSRRLCLSLRWAIPSWVPPCTCIPELVCAACQGPGAEAPLWLSARRFCSSPRGLRSLFRSNGLIWLQLLLVIACLLKASSSKNKEKKMTLFITLTLMTENIDHGNFLLSFFMWNNHWSFMANLDRFTATRGLPRVEAPRRCLLFQNPDGFCGLRELTAGAFEAVPSRLLTLILAGSATSALGSSVGRNQLLTRGPHFQRYFTASAFLT